MSGSSNTIRVVIPLSIRKRNGRPKILPPEDHCAREGRMQDPHVLRGPAAVLCRSSDHILCSKGDEP